MLNRAHYKSHINFMQQAATFAIPKQQKECNELLATIKRRYSAPRAERMHRRGNLPLKYPTRHRRSGFRFNIHAGIQCVTDRRLGP